MNIGTLHPLESVFREQAPRLLANKIGSHIFGVKRAVELLMQFPEQARFSDITQIFEKEQGLSIRTQGNYFDIPPSGPLIVAANHPYPLLDAISIGKIIEQRRGGVIKVLSNSPVGLMPEWDHLNISIGANMDQMIQTQRVINELLGDGGTLIMFPAGMTSHRDVIDQVTQETNWKPGVIKFSKQGSIPILPVHVEAETSDIYNFLKNFFPLHLTRQLNLRESTRKNISVNIRIGGPISEPHLTANMLRDEIYKLVGQRIRI